MQMQKMNTSKDTKKSEKQDQLKSSLTSSKGAIFFAYNNEQLNYIKLACLSAASVKKHLNLPCTMITDQGSLNHSKENNIFDNVIIEEHKNWVPNVRNYYDTPYASYKGQFNNLNKHDSYYSALMQFETGMDHAGQINEKSF